MGRLAARLRSPHRFRVICVRATNSCGGTTSLSYRLAFSTRPIPIRPQVMCRTTINPVTRPMMPRLVSPRTPGPRSCTAKTSPIRARICSRAPRNPSSPSRSIGREPQGCGSVTSSEASSLRRYFVAAGTWVLFGLGLCHGSSPVLAASAYTPITPTLADKTITLTGHDLTIEQIVQVARYGAKVAVSPEAQQREADNYGLLLEAAAEGIAVYWFNRGAGDQRETVMFSGDPMTPKNKAYLEKSQLQEFQLGAIFGYGPEVGEEEIVRAMMVVRANAMTSNAPSPQLSQMLVDLLNHRITPVVLSRGTLGEGDLAQLSNVGAAMVGAGDAYYPGTRMTAAEALAKAGLKPIQPFAADTNALTSSDAYGTGIAA